MPNRLVFFVWDLIMTKTECKEKLIKYFNVQLNKLNVEQLNKLVKKHTGKKKPRKKSK